MKIAIGPMAAKQIGRQLRPVLVRYFEGPVAETENSFRTVPDLLRQVANWMDTENLEDPEFEDLIIKVRFPDLDNDDWIQTATLYYRSGQVTDKE